MNFSGQLVLPLLNEPILTFDSLIVHEGIDHAVKTVKSVYSRESTADTSKPFPFWSVRRGKTHILNALFRLLQNRFPSEPSAVRFLNSDNNGLNPLELQSLVSEEQIGLGRLKAVLRRRCS